MQQMLILDMMYPQYTNLAIPISRIIQPLTTHRRLINIFRSATISPGKLSS